MNIIEETLLASNSKISIIVGRFNNFINQHLLNGTLDILQRIGQVRLENISIIYVPGAYEIPTIASIIAKKRQCHAIIALGTIIKGDTAHFFNISNDVSSKISNISIQYSIPIAFGIILADDINQAIERAGTKKGNKGSEAALTVLEMINICNYINKN